MPDIALAVLAIATLLVLVALLQPLAARLSLPHAVLIAGLGIAIGAIGTVTGVIGSGKSTTAKALITRSTAALGHRIMLPIISCPQPRKADISRATSQPVTSYATDIQ